jgi:lipopolysaccharide transport system permease protein
VDNFDTNQTEEVEDWDLRIVADGSLLSLKLVEAWNHRDLLYLLTRRDIVAFYKQTILGPAWFFIQPICTTLIFTIIFGQVAQLSTDGLPHIAFYLCGITLWNYFSECFNKTATVFRDNAQLFGKVYFPRIIVPFSIVISNLVRFAIQFLLFLVVSGWYFWEGSIQPQWSIVLFPVVVCTMATLGLACGMLFSAMTTKYRDLVFLLQFGVQLLMYATPVIYPSSQVPARLETVLSWNPLNSLFEITRHGFLGAGQWSLAGLAYSIVFTASIFLIAVVIFNRVERTFMDTV